MTSESSLLQLKLDHAVPALESASRRAWDRPDADRFREYLAVCHMATRATVPLLEFAVAECRARPATDGVAARLVSYYLAQIEEERGHDAALLDDFTAAGGDPSALLRRVPRPEIAALVGAQYYWVRHSHPVALVGHMAVLEGYPPPPAVLERIRHATGLPPACFRTLAAHTELDRHHRKELAELLDSLPLDDRCRSLVGIAALHAVQLLVTSVDRLATLDMSQERTGTHE
ncbi:iron-containing redox enzyme family protein [Streptomyces sp. NBC_00287]|uniref:iron-containing redox enzyme family protein n=1 Tax=Streptomyces sp. NBC_00287 TaxID=2975702 RepID=UPI002E29988A|nr:iron-containing redox enzyme family protein [Streptomyces sp. NBC_00287]